MSPLNINSANEIAVMEKKETKKKKLLILIGVAALIAVPIIGTTYAATITVASGPVQFGQGVVQTTACDTSITLTPTTSFTNVAGAGSFKVATVVLGDIADACSGKKFKVTAYGNDGQTALVLSAGGTNSPSCFATPTLAAGGNTIVSETSNTCVGTVGTYSEDENTITFTAATVLDASTVYKFTVETSA